MTLEIPVRRMMQRVAITALMAAAAASHAQTTDVPLRIVIGLSAGGSLDAMARALADKLRVSLKRPVVIDNRPGASTKVAIQYVARAPADGNTVLIATVSPFTVFPLTNKSLPYDYERDFQPVAHLANSPVAAAAGINRSYRDMREYVAWLRSHPDSNGVGLSGLGGVIHFGLTAWSTKANVPLVYASYRGTSQILTDVVGDVLPIGMDGVGSMIELARAGKIRLLGITGDRRSKLLPQVLTFKEQGMPELELVSTWWAAYVPSATPADTVKKLEKAFMDGAQDPELARGMLALGVEATGQPGAVDKLIREQSAHWKPIVAATGFKADE